MKASELYLQDIRNLFREYKEMAEKTLTQIDDDDFFQAVDAESNSVAVIVKHMAGNLRSRWRDFLTSDGEKEDRHRDNEFVVLDSDSRESLMAAWDNGWMIALDSIDSLKPKDLTRTITIRSEPHSVLEAINRAITHSAYHVGQIVLLAKQYKGEEWRTLSIPRNKSEDFNKSMRKRES